MTAQYSDSLSNLCAVSGVNLKNNRSNQTTFMNCVSFTIVSFPQVSISEVQYLVVVPPVTCVLSGAEDGYLYHDQASCMGVEI